MKEVPVFYLRKPWYLILKHTTSNIKQSAQWREGLTGLSSKLLNNITSVHDSNEIKLSNEELLFIRKFKISYEDVYIIRSNAIGKLCAILARRWFEIGKDDNEYGQKVKATYQKAFRGKEVLTKSSWQEKIHRPLSAINVPLSSNTFVYDTIAEYICLIARITVKNNKDELAALDRILDAIEEIPLLSAKLKPEEADKRSIIKHDLFWRQADNNSVPDRFSNSNWESYERTDANANPDATWGVAKSYVHIGKQNDRGYTPIIFKSCYNNNYYESTGIVTYDINSKYLIAQIFRHSLPKDDIPQTPSFFIMRVRDAENQSLLIGHYVNFSIYFERFLTKTVIWLRCEKEFPPLDLVDVDQDFNSIDISVRRFLYNRSQNRLTLPQVGLSNLKNLNDKDRSLFFWLEKRLSDVYRDKKLLACVDKYYVCYFFGDAFKPTKIVERQKSNDKLDESSLHDYIAKFIRIDELKITYNENEVAFGAEYTHNTHSIGRGANRTVTSSSYTGKVVRKNLTVQVFVEQDKFMPKAQKAKTTTGNFILLNFKLPVCNEDKAFEVFNQSDYFEGIVSGLSDFDNNPLSFRAILVKHRLNKKNKKNVVRLNFADKRGRNNLSRSIIDYFENHIAQYQIKITNSSNAR